LAREKHGLKGDPQTKESFQDVNHPRENEFAGGKQGAGGEIGLTNKQKKKNVQQQRNGTEGMGSHQKEKKVPKAKKGVPLEKPVIRNHM